MYDVYEDELEAEDGVREKFVCVQKKRHRNLLCRRKYCRNSYYKIVNYCDTEWKGDDD